jgi:hypothetical protein
MFHQPMRVARAAMAAGLGLAMALGPIPTALADAGGTNTPVPGEYANPEFEKQQTAESKGDTKLYITGVQDDLTTSEGSVTENIKVTIPVAIHYVADTEGNLRGPSDNTVKFVNNTKLGAVHVSKIAVESAEGAKIVGKNDALGADRMVFSVQPVQGTWDEQNKAFNKTDVAEETAIDDLGYYSTDDGSAAKDPKKTREWDIAGNHGALALNHLTGRIGGFSAIDSGTDYQAGTIHWTVRAGTRAQADKRDATVTVHFNANNGSNKDCAPLGDLTAVVFQPDSLPEKVVNAREFGKALAPEGGVVIPPKTYTQQDGTVVTKAFKGWSRQPDGSELVAWVSDLGRDAEAIAGKTFELYAIYE